MVACSVTASWNEIKVYYHYSVSGRKKEKNGKIYKRLMVNFLSREESVEVWTKPPVRPVQWSLTIRVIASTPDECVPFCTREDPGQRHKESRGTKSVLCLTVWVNILETCRGVSCRGVS